MPRLLKKNYESAIARNAQARRLRATMPKSLTLKQLQAITNKYKISVTSTKMVAPANLIKPISNVNKREKELARRSKLALIKRAPERAAYRAKRKEMQIMKTINTLLNEIVKNIETKEDLEYVMKNLDKKPRKISTPMVVPKSSGAGSKLFKARKKLTPKNVKKSVVEPIPKSKSVKKKKAVSIIKKK